MLVHCKLCNKEFEKDNYAIKRTKNNNFCSRSCSASYNNQKSPKRQLASSKTLKDYESSNYRTFKSRVCDHARRTYKNANKSYSCYFCNYSLHVEIAHINPIASFSKEALISEVNHPDNLVALCPTHHWEFDNGFIKL